MFGEKYLNPDNYYDGRDAADNESMYTGWNNDNYRITSRDRVPMEDRPGYGSTTRFGSAHWSGCHFVFCDGRVKMISYTIAPDVYELLGNRKDGVVLDGGKY